MSVQEQNQIQLKQMWGLELKQDSQECINAKQHKKNYAMHWTLTEKVTLYAFIKNKKEYFINRKTIKSYCPFIKISRFMAQRNSWMIGRKFHSYKKSYRHVDVILEKMIQQIQEQLVQKSQEQKEQIRAIQQQVISFLYQEEEKKIQQKQLKKSQKHKVSKAFGKLSQQLQQKINNFCYFDEIKSQAENVCTPYYKPRLNGLTPSNWQLIDDFIYCEYLRQSLSCFGEPKQGNLRSWIKRCALLLDQRYYIDVMSHHYKLLKKLGTCENIIKVINIGIKYNLSFQSELLEQLSGIRSKIEYFIEKEGKVRTLPAHKRKYYFDNPAKILQLDDSDDDSDEDKLDIKIQDEEMEYVREFSHQNKSKGELEQKFMEERNNNEFQAQNHEENGGLEKFKRIGMQ